ncbi:MAG: DUF3108 domain-containing protein [Dehalococcoidia bacterium]|nr:DUF3108 domain-containing protein [Dehalococcoidia bacterium]
MIRARLAVAGIAALGLLAAACGDDSHGPTARVFEAAPWNGPETYEYQLSVRGDEDAGRCTLKTEPEVEPGRTKLSRLCSEDEYRDDGEVIVDSTTLQPFSAQRTFIDGEKDRTTVYVTTYRDTDVLFEADVNGKTSETTRELPEPTEESPEPVWHDDESLLWLVRGVPLRAGFTGTYAHVINAGQPRVLTVDIEVDEPETVEYEGGEAEAWKVTVKREKSTYRVWVETAAPHRVLRAQIESVTYTLIP